MLNKIKYTAIAFLFIIAGTNTTFGLSKTESNEIFTKANQLYLEQNYTSADSLLKSVEEAGYYSPELYYNLGNINYKLGNIPETVYYYEKALKLDPGNDDIIHNLKLANKLLADKNPIKTSTRINDLLYTFIHSSANFWAIVSLILFGLGGISIVIFMVNNAIRIRKIAFYIGISAFLTGSIAVYFASLEYHKLGVREYGIVFTPYVELKTGPSEQAGSAFILHEGTKVKILNENAHWYEVSFGDGQIAWIKKTDLKAI